MVVSRGYLTFIPRLVGVIMGQEYTSPADGFEGPSKQMALRAVTPVGMLGSSQTRILGKGKIGLFSGAPNSPK